MSRPPAETTALPFEEDNSGMYGDWDLPEDNERIRREARELIALLQPRRSMLLTDLFAALVITVAASLALYAVDFSPGKMLGMFAGPQLSSVEQVPTVYAPTTEYRRRP